MQALNFDITGMTCGGCTGSVKRVLGKLDGVSHVEFSLTLAVRLCRWTLLASQLPGFSRPSVPSATKPPCDRRTWPATRCHEQEGSQGPQTRGRQAYRQPRRCRTCDGLLLQRGARRISAVGAKVRGGARQLRHQAAEVLPRHRQARARPQAPPSESAIRSRSGRPARSMQVPSSTGRRTPRHATPCCCEPTPQSRPGTS